MNKKGFTMIELLATVVIIGILGTTAVVGVTKIIESSHDKYNLAQAKLFVTAAQTYFTDNKSKVPSRTFTTKQVTLEELVSSNYIDEIVDYKKEPYDTSKSYAYVTKMGTGQYVYDGELLTTDGERTKYQENSDGKNTVTYKIEEDDFSEGTTKYTNGEKTVKINMTGSYDIAGYIVTIKGKSIGTKELEYKEVGNSKSANTTIKLSKNDYPDGTYKLIVELIDIYNNRKKVTSGNLLIDTIKPTCKITDSGTKGKLNGVETGWYISNAKMTMNIVDVNKDKALLTTIKQKGTISYKNTKGEAQIIENQVSTKGIKWYGYVKDKAGNTNTCESATIKVDTEKPTCTVTGKNDTWTMRDIKLTGTCSKESEKVSGCAGSGTVEKTINYSAQTASPGSIYDIAGNETICDNVNVMIDKSTPSVSISNSNNNKWKGKEYVDANKYKFKVNTTNIGSSGLNKLQRKDGTGSWENINTTNSNYETAAWKAERNSTVYYRAISNAAYNDNNSSPTTSNEASTIIKIDKTPPILSNNGFNTYTNDDKSTNNGGTRTVSCSDPKSNGVSSDISGDTTITTTYGTSGWKIPNYTCKDNAGNESDSSDWSQVCCTCRRKSDGKAIFNADNIAEDGYSDWNCSLFHSYVYALDSNKNKLWRNLDAGKMYASCRTSNCPGANDLYYIGPSSN